MRLIVMDVVSILKKWEILNKDMYCALHEYINEIYEVYDGKKSFRDIQETHDLYIQKLDIWRKYFHQHRKILIAFPEYINFRKE